MTGHGRCLSDLALTVAGVETSWRRGGGQPRLAGMLMPVYRHSERVVVGVARRPPVAARSPTEPPSPGVKAVRFPHAQGLFY